MALKSKKIKRIEEEHGRPIAELLPEIITEHNGISGAARALGQDKATVHYWAVAFGIEVWKVGLGPGDKVTIERANKS